MKMMVRGAGWEHGILMRYLMMSLRRHLIRDHLRASFTQSGIIVRHIYYGLDTLVYSE